MNSFLDYVSLDEGIIKSYPRKKLLQGLKRFSKKVLSSWNNIAPLTDWEQETDDEWALVELTATIRTDDDPNTLDAPTREEFHKELKKVLGRYGWNIGVEKYRDADVGGLITVMIEPSRPPFLEYDPSTNKGRFFHITTPARLSKIKKSGLTPKDSTTVMSHTGDRVYLLYAPAGMNKGAMTDELDDYAFALNGGRKNSVDGASPILEVRLTKPTRLYMDKMSASALEKIKGLTAVFVHQSIHPKNLKEFDLDFADDTDPNKAPW